MPNYDPKLTERLLGDPAWRAVLVIFDSLWFRNSKAVWGRVDLQRGSIDFDEILKHGWSGGERRLLRIAASLFNQDLEINLWASFAGLDEHGSLVAIRAIAEFAEVDWALVCDPHEQGRASRRAIKYRNVRD